MPLDDYRRKRDFIKSPEPKGRFAPSPTGRLYVIQKHDARRLHYDLRLELDGVLKSWAVPKGPSLDPREKRLAVEVEDHPIAYGGFEGIIPENAYGAGTVLVWDYGEWEPEGDPRHAYENGRLKFRLRGRKLKGSWALARMKADPVSDKPQWLLIKHRDSEAVGDDADGILQRRPESVLSGRMIEEIAEDKDWVWQDGEAVPSAPEGAAQKSEGLPFDPAGLPGARKAEFPDTFHPQKAVPVESPPAGDDWLHEIKYDGYRLLCVIRDRRAALVTRNGNDWTDRFPQIVYEAAALPVENAILDGEVVVQRKDGTTDFQALQNYLKGRKKGTLAYFLFDLPYLEGHDLSAVPLKRRKQALKALLQPGKSAVLRFGGEIVGRGQTVYRRACELGIEGIVSKKIDAPYQQERSASWVKTKCRLQQEFVIGGYSASEAAPAGVRSLLLGYYNPAGQLIYAGRVGTGFSHLQREALRKMLQARARKTPAFANPPRDKNLYWAAPELVAEVIFAEWTAEGILRHPSFKGLREDKPADQVVLESPLPARGALRPQPFSKAAREDDADMAGIQLSNPHRVLYPEAGITKKALAAYYQAVAGRMLPYLVDRPLSLVRCPGGHTGECFYQKHINETLPEALKGVRIREENQERTYIYIADQAGLLSLVQISTLEIHPWGSRVDDPDAPDTLIFDLDPDPALNWEHVIHAAWHLRGILQGMGLTSFVKTSGGKGLHVQLPIKRTPSWDAVKQFARRIATDMATAHPARYTANPRKASRKGKIFVDYLRNARGATSVAPYSTRARAGAPLSTPVAWEALSATLRPDTFTLQNLPEHLRRSGKDPWKEYFRVENDIPR